MDLLIYGEISPYSLNASAEGVAYALRQAAPDEPLTVRVHSPGGSPFEASAMRAQLESHKGPVTVVVDGLAASAAAHFLATQGARVEMTEGAFVMVHNTSTGAGGEADDLEREAKMLRAVDAQTADMFARRTGKTPAQVAALMNATTWLSARAAVENGFADAVVPARAEVLQRFSPRAWDGAPRQALDKWTGEIIPCQSKPMALDKEIRQRLSLSENATDAEVFAALDAARATPVQNTPAVEPPAPAAAPDLATLVAEAVAKALAAQAAPEAHGLAVQTAVDNAIAQRKVRPADRAVAIAACGKDATQLAAQVNYWTAAPALVVDPAAPPTPGPDAVQLSPMLQRMAKSAGLTETAVKAEIAKENAK